MYRERKGFRWVEIENRIADILEIDGRIGEMEVKLILFYFRTGNEEEDSIKIEN